LSRGLIEAMSGTLNPEGTPGGGLTMTISLPAVTQPISEAGPVDTRSPDAEPRSEPVESASERP